MYDLPDNWMCWMHWNHLLDVPQPSPWLSPLVAIACCRDCSPSCTHFPPQIGQAFVHHLIFNQIRSRLSCHAARGVNAGSCALPSANEKLQSTHGCHFLSCLPELIWGTEKVWLTRPVRFPTYDHPAGPRTNNGSTSLHTGVSSKAIISNGSNFQLTPGTNCLSIKWIWSKVFSETMRSPGLWWNVVSLRHHWDIWKVFIMVSHLPSKTQPMALQHHILL